MGRDSSPKGNGGDRVVNEMTPGSLGSGAPKKKGGAEQRQDDVLLEALLEDAIGAHQEPPPSTWVTCPSQHV